MKINFLTWNMQGAFEYGSDFSSKRNVICSNCNTKAVNIIAIQEAGSPQSSPLIKDTEGDGTITFKIGRKNVQFYCDYCEDILASEDGKRCTTMLLVEKCEQVIDIAFYTTDLHGGTRPMLCADIAFSDGSVYTFASKHCIADSSQSILELNGDLTELETAGKSYFSGGDFNCFASDLNFDYRGVYTKGEPTQGPKLLEKVNLYDYFISNVDVISSLIYPKVQGIESLSSDHIPARIEFDL